MHKIQYDQLTDSQRQAVFHIDGPLLILAGPGSGKTRVITYRIAALIDSGVRPYNICAITFTNKAAEEMRQRAAGLGASGGAHISTFHSLCVRVLRRYADQACIKSNFSIYDTSEQSRCMKQAIKDCGFDSGNFSPAPHPARRFRSDACGHSVRASGGKAAGYPARLKTPAYRKSPVEAGEFVKQASPDT